VKRLENKAFSLSGRGGTALLVHGLGGGPYEVQWLGEAIHERTGLSVRAFHLPGHEAFGTWMPASDHAQWIAAASREIRALRGSGPVHLVGFSTGATICLRMAEIEAMDGRVALLAPFVSVYKPPLLPVRAEVLLDALPGLKIVPRRGPRLGDRALRREVSRCLPFATMNLDAARSAKALIGLSMRDLGAVKAPVLIVQGARDGVVDPAGAKAIFAGIQGEKRLVELPGSDHLVALDGERERVFDEVVRFLKGE